MSMVGKFTTPKVGECRFCLTGTNKRKEVFILKSSLNDSGEISYYVHFIGEDNRMDTWLPGSAILGLLAEQSGKRSHSNLPEVGVKRAKISGPKVSSLISHRHHIRNVEEIYFFKYRIKCWYYSAYPVARFENLPSLFICHKTFKYMRKLKTFKRHLNKTENLSNPPGKLFYKEDNFGRLKLSIEVYEIQGVDHPLFCQNLCLFSKLFIEHKNTRYDPKPFVFNLLIERYEDNSFAPVGYFSRENNSEHNLSCILIFPPFQKRGYGRFLISLSYAVSKRIGLIGSPEKPLSDLGKISYRSYWTFSLLSVIQEKWKSGEPGMSLKELSKKTYIRGEDILSTFAAIGFVKKTKVGLVTFFKREEIDACMVPFIESKFGESTCKPSCFI